MRINKQDTNGTKPLLGKGELGYDDYTAGGDTGRVYVGNGSENIPQAKKSEVVTVDGKIDTHIGRVDNPHTVTKAQVGLANVDNTADANKNVLSATKLTTARNITLSGDVTGTASFNGSADASITTIVADNSHLHTIANVTGLQTSLDNKVDDTEKGSANGVATLDTNGKITLTQIPDSVLGQLEYQGVWDFTTLPTATQKGQYWIASVSGNGYVVGDWAVWNGVTFDKVDNTDAVASVAGRTGNVVLTKSDIGLTNVDNTADSTKNVLSATKLTTTRNIALTGDITGNVNFDGSGNVSIATTIAANSVVLGTGTTGNYAAGNTAGTGITVAGTAGEGWSPTISIDGTVATLTGVQTLTNKTLQDSTTFIVDNTDATKKVQFDASGLTTATTRTMTVPNVNGTLITSGDTGTVTSTMLLDGTIVNADINASAGIVDTKLATISTAGKVANSATTATNLNTINAIVARDASGNFSAGAVTAALSGNATTATTLQTARTITIGNTGKTFNGSANVSWSISDIGAQPINADLTAISALVGTTGLLKKTAADTWTLDTNAYVTSSGVTSVSGTGTVSGLSLSGTVTASGNLTLGGTLAVLPSNFASQAANAVLAAPNGVAGVPTFRAIVASDIPVLNQSTTGSAATLTTSRTIGMTGDVTWTSASFNGAGNVTGVATLATITDSGAGTFKKITTNTKGLVTGTQAVAQADITGLLGTGSITNTMLANAAVANLSGTNTGDQTITLTGDVTGAGTGSFATTLANSGVTAGTFSKVTVDAKGRVTAGLIPTMEDIPDATFKKSVRVATTANITLSAPQTIDGIALVAGDRVLVKDQTTTSQNGIYVVAAGAWTRALDADTASKIASALVTVDSGTANGGKLFDNDFKTTDTLGTTAMLWAFNLDSGSLSSTTPSVAGTAAIGTRTTVARADHVHPAQTTITGNAGTATTLQTARTISGVSFNGSANIEIEDRLGTAIASATTTTIGTIGLGDYIHITGVATITSLGTAAAAGIRRTLIFDGALTLTHNATSLICPGAANIVTVAGTVIEVVAETTANWRVVSITHPSLGMLELGYLDGVTSSIQTQLNAKAALASPALTGTPTAPTAAVNTNTTQVATTAFVNAEIANDAVPRVTSTDNAIARFNGTTGDIQNSAITIDDSGNIGSGTQSFNGYGGSGFKNYIINGNFDIWQYGASQESLVDGLSGYGSDDRWVNQYVTTYRKHTRQLTSNIERLLFNAQYFSRTEIATGGTSGSLALKKQHIEDVTRLAGKTVTLSFWARADASKNISMEVVQVFGTGGSPSAIVDKQCITIVPVTNTWQKKTITINIPSIVGKTLGTDGRHTSYTQIRLWLDAGSTFNLNTNSLGNQSGTFDIAQVQLEEGSVATPFENRPYGLEVSLCQRYYVVVNESPRVEGSAAYPNAAITYSYYYPVKMRTLPTALNCFWGNGYNAVGGTMTIANLLLHAELLAASTGNRFYADLYIGSFSAEL